MSEQYQTYEASPIEPWEIPSFEDSNKAFDLIDEGVYTLVLAEVGPPQPVSEKYDTTGKKRRAQFKFKVVDDEDWEGYEINMWMNISMNEKSVLYPFVKALMGDDFNTSMSIQPGLILGRRMRAMVAHGEPNAEGKVWATIKSPLAIRERKGRTPVQAVAEHFDAVEESDQTLNTVPF